MNPEPVRIDLKTLRSLSPWEQALAEVLREKGQLILTDEKPQQEGC